MKDSIKPQVDPLMQSYQQYHRELIGTLAALIKKTPPFDQYGQEDGATEHPNESVTLDGDGSISSQDLLEPKVLEALETLQDTQLGQQDIAQSGQWLINTIIGQYPHITPFVPRDLLWYFGGDCMHFLGDEEISHFQAVDEALYLAQGEDSGVKEYTHILQQVSGQSRDVH